MPYNVYMQIIHEVFAIWKLNLCAIRKLPYKLGTLGYCWKAFHGEKL